jgi:lipoyl-dependent peroxiredoxin
MKRSASAQWQGNLKEGSGKISTESGILSHVPYSFSTRFESRVGTNPEELIAAAHAGCFAMALSSELSKLGFLPELIHSDATVVLEKIESDWTITKISLGVSANVPGISDSQFMKAAETAKSGCPVSKLLKAEISLKAQLMTEKMERSAS